MDRLETILKRRLLFYGSACISGIQIFPGFSRRFKTERMKGGAAMKCFRATGFFQRSCRNEIVEEFNDV